DGGEASLPPLPMQYADYAVWQREQLRGEVLDRQLAYWRERLAGAPALLELPTDRTRPALQTYRGAQERIALPRELVDGLRTLGRGEGATLYMVLLGAFQLLLAKHAGSDDVVVGSPVAGRTRGEVEALIGFFVNTLVLRTDLSGDPPFREVLRRVRQVTLGAWEHQEVPFERLVAELQPRRSLSHSPLFQVMFSLSDGGRGAARLAGVEAREIGGELEAASFDLSLSLVTDAGGVWGTLGYNTDLFDRATIQRMAGQLGRLLAQVAHDPAAPASALDLLGPAEREQVVEAWNRTDAPVPLDLCLHQLVEAQAARTPGAVALWFEDTRVTYRELDADANRVARLLRARGIAAEDRVALYMEPRPRAVAALLGILKAGAMFVPLDVAAPRERVRRALDDAGAALVLAQGDLAGALDGCGREVVAIDAPGALTGLSAEAVEGGAGPRGAAWMIFTSGSTGRPKGVVVEHRSAVNMTASAIQLASITADARILLFAPLHFDAALADLFPALATGATLCMVPRETLFPGPELVEFLESRGVTHAKLTPSALAAVPRAPLPRLRTLTVGGEACPAALVSAWAPGRTFLNVYGPTETTVRVTATELAPGDAATIGRPIINARAYVLDAAMRPVPVGVPGELYVGGAAVGRGYWRHPARTAERFVPDPFAPEPGARLYRTGDRVRWRADG
ncbi:MAG TPA: amino acid adenylation domain-containing protein, partial [Longimicrobium sp.]|nr:amino acid adenylation domain-containing protein [Longimicrobium sp.]